MANTLVTQLYEEDARVGHREFDLKLTQRVKMSMVSPSWRCPRKVRSICIRLVYRRWLSTSGQRQYFPPWYLCVRTRITSARRKFLAKGTIPKHTWAAVGKANDDVFALGYKVGRVDQAETALGAEMRVAANKSRGKAGDDKQKEKIVRRFVAISWAR